MENGPVWFDDFALKYDDFASQLLNCQIPSFVWEYDPVAINS
jgi:hypothetical protein